MSNKDKINKREKSEQSMSNKINTKKRKHNQTNKESNDDFPTDWDLDKYRTEYESDDHWQLRRSFLEAHKSKFAENKLVCLAQVFINMEILGCKYPEDTMRLVSELSKDVATDFRTSRANRLKRTFVTASEAAESRAKAPSKNNFQTTNIDPKDSVNYGLNCSAKLNISKNKRLSLFDGLKYGKFVLFLNKDCNCIKQSCDLYNIKYLELKTTEEVPPFLYNIKIYVNEEFVAEANGDDMKKTKSEGYIKALNTLQEHCYTIQRNPLRDTIKVEKTKCNTVTCVLTKSVIDANDQKLDATNKGYRIMKMMGWTGGGLGTQQQGRENPVSYLLRSNRAGLGNEAAFLDHRFFTQMLENYVQSDDIRELQFEPNFTKNERAMLHSIATKFNLTSKSYGNDEERRLIIRKKNITYADILMQILLKKNSQYLDQYFVQVPVSKQHLFPDHTAKLSL